MAKKQNDAEEMDDFVADDDSYSESLLDVNLDDAQEEVAVEPGEYSLTVQSAKVGRKTSESQPYLLVRLTVDEVTNAKDITHVMMLPSPDHEDEKQVNRRKLRLIEFFEAIGQQFHGPIDLAGLKGAQCWAVLKQEENDEYGLQNRIASFTAGA